MIVSPDRKFYLREATPALLSTSILLLDQFQFAVNHREPTVPFLNFALGWRQIGIYTRSLSEVSSNYYSLLTP